MSVEEWSQMAIPQFPPQLLPCGLFHFSRQCLFCSVACLDFPCSVGTKPPQANGVGLGDTFSQTRLFSMSSRRQHYSAKPGAFPKPELCSIMMFALVFMASSPVPVQSPWAGRTGAGGLFPPHIIVRESPARRKLSCLWAKLS